jgi:hypothetical protein
LFINLHLKDEALLVRNALLINILTNCDVGFRLFFFYYLDLEICLSVARGRCNNFFRLNISNWTRMLELRGFHNRKQTHGYYLHIGTR